MDWFDWLKPGLKIKRWLFLGSLGIAFFILGAYGVINKLFLRNQFFDYCGILLLLGILFIGMSLKKGVASIINLLDTPGNLVKSKIDKKLYEKRILNKGPKMVIVGGGTGLSVLLRGLKKYTSNITAIVTVADDGGGSGILREDLGMLPPGDIRNCILALADTEPIMEKLLQYRFEEGQLKGQSFGNLLIAAMNGISDNFEEAIKKINHVLAVTGKVLPVTVEDITLYAKLENGKVIKGESQIPIKVKEINSGIDQVFIKPGNVKPLEESIEEIMNADVIILGPGSLYTSIIPNLLVADIRKAIRESKAKKVYITNVMTQPGETDGYTVLDHVEKILKYLKSENIDYVFVNGEKIPKEVLKKYAHDRAEPIRMTKEERQILRERDIHVIEGPFVDIKKKYIRHDADKLAEMITKLVEEEKDLLDKKKMMAYSFK